MMRRRAAGPVVLCIMAAAVFACTADPPTVAPPPSGAGAPAVAVSSGQPLQTPDVYTSKAGKLHLRVKAEQVASTINTQPYNNLSVFTTSLVGDDGTSPDVFAAVDPYPAIGTDVAAM